MNGIYAADLIASPYRNNPRESTGDIFFPLFEPSSKVVLKDKKARVTTYEPRMSVLSETATAAADWYLGSQRSLEEWKDRRPSNVSFPDILVACGPIVELSANREEAHACMDVIMSGFNASAREASMVYTDLLFAARNKSPKSHLRQILQDAGYDTSMNASLLRPALDGLVIYTDGKDGNRTVAMGSGKVNKSPEYLFPAVFAAYNESENYEGCIRKAVAMGGDCVLTAALAGAFAEKIWTVPDGIDYRVDDYLTDKERALMNRGRRLLDARNSGMEIQNNGVDPIVQVNGEPIRVISMEGYRPVYGIPEDRQDMRDAVNAIQKNLGADGAIIVKPEELQGIFEQLSVQRDKDGNELAGVFFERSRPEFRTLWFKDGELKSNVTRVGIDSKGRALSSLVYRAGVWNEFVALKDEAMNIRRELERYADLSIVDKFTARVSKSLSNFFSDTRYPERVKLIGRFDEYGVEHVRKSLAKISAENGNDIAKFDAALNNLLMMVYYPRPYDEKYDTSKFLDKAQNVAFGEFVPAVRKSFNAFLDGLDGSVFDKQDVSRAVGELSSLMKNLNKNTFYDEFRGIVSGVAEFEPYLDKLQDLKRNFDVRTAQVYSYGVSKDFLEVFKSTGNRDVVGCAQFYRDFADAMKVLRENPGTKIVYCKEHVHALIDKYAKDLDMPELLEFKKRVTRIASEFRLVEGRALHFSSAFFPEVYHDHIELYQGDILRGRCGLDDDCRFRVDTNVRTGSLNGEYLEGAMNAMDIFTKGDNMDQVREKLNEYCLDHGRIPSEEEAKHLELNDDEAESIKMKYHLNIYRVFEDLKVNPKEAVTDITVLDNVSLNRSAVQVRKAEQNRVKSVENHKGKTSEDILYSKSYVGSVFTIGHSNMKPAEFNALIKRFGIDFVVDIRSVPASKKYPHFNEKALSESLADMGVDYQNVKEFGGHQHYKDNPDMYILSYDEVFEKKEFAEKMENLRKCVEDGSRIALLCAESDPMDCHRMLMMGRALAHPEVYGSTAEPIDVQHITRKGYVLSQEFFEKKLVVHAGLADNSIKPTGASVMDKGVENKFDEKYTAETNAIIEHYNQLCKDGSLSREDADRLTASAIYDYSEKVLQGMKAKAGDSVKAADKEDKVKGKSFPADVVNKAYKFRSDEVIKDVREHAKKYSKKTGFSSSRKPRGKGYGRK